MVRTSSCVKPNKNLKDYLERPSEEARFQAFLEENPGKVLLFRGESGSGKSIWLKHWYFNNRQKVVASFSDMLHHGKKAGGHKGADSDEYLSGFMKNDKLMPVVTLVIYFDPKAWDGSMSIHEMFEYDDDEML